MFRTHGETALHHVAVSDNIIDQLNIYYLRIRYLVSTAAIKITITQKYALSHRISIALRIGFRTHWVYGTRKWEIVLNEVEVLCGAFICIEYGLKLETSNAHCTRT